MAVGSLTGALMAARRTRIRLRLVVGAALVFGVVEIVAGLMPTYLAFVLSSRARLHRADHDHRRQHHDAAGHAPRCAGG